MIRVAKKIHNAGVLVSSIWLHYNMAEEQKGNRPFTEGATAWSNFTSHQVTLARQH